MSVSGEGKAERQEWCVRCSTWHRPPVDEDCHREDLRG
jgi:hypothetical protein